MKMVKNRELKFRRSDLEESQIVARLTQIDSKAALLWIGYQVGKLLHSCYFRLVAFEDNTDKYFCELVCRYDHANDMVLIKYKEIKKEVL